MIVRTPLKTSRFSRAAQATCALAVAATLCAAPTYGAAYYLHANQTGTTYDTLTDWFDHPTTGGANPATLNGNQFYSNSFAVRTGTGNSSFGNASTTVTINSSIGVRAGPTNQISIPGTLIMAGSDPRISAGAGDVKISVNNFNNAVDSLFNTSFSNRSITASITTLTGSGDLRLTHGSFLTDANGSVRLSVTNASGFTGDIGWANANPVVLDFNNDLVSGGGLVVPGTGRIKLDQNVSFATVTINGTELDPGTYAYADLNTEYDAIFLDVGSGSITVVPEPAGVVLLGALTVATLRRRSRAIAR